MFRFEHIQNSESRGARDGIAAKGAEELHSIVETGGDFKRRDDGRKRKSVPDWFSEHHDIRDDTLRLESPEVGAQAAEADLHFVGNAYSASGADVFVTFSEISGRKKDLASNTRQRLGGVRSHASAIRARLLQYLGNVLCVFCTGLRIAAAKGTAIIIGNGRHVDPRLAAAASRPVKFVRADVDEGGGVAVVGVFKDDEVFAASVGARQAQRKFVRFAAGIYEKADAQRLGQKMSQALSVAIDIVVKIAGVGIEESDLLLHGPQHARMAVPDKRDIVVDVEKGAANVIVKILHPSAHNLERLLIRNAEIFS